jgi:hypothetical protein
MINAASGGFRSSERESLRDVRFIIWVNVIYIGSALGSKLHQDPENLSSE